MKENSPDDLVGAYLKGKLARPDLEDFEKQVESNPDLAEAVALRRAEMAASELLIASETRDLFGEWQQGGPPPRNFFSPGSIAWLAALAVGACLFAFLIRTRQQENLVPADKPGPPANVPAKEMPAPVPPITPKGPAVELLPEKKAPLKHTTGYYRALAERSMPDPLLSNLRQPSADSVVSTFRQAQLAYEAGKFAQTLDLLAQTDSSRLQSATFLKAHALFRLKRFGEAEALFSRLVEWNSRQFRFQSEWGLLMCRLSDYSRRKKEVRRQLDEILAKPEHPYFEKAKSLQNELKE